MTDGSTREEPAARGGVRERYVRSLRDRRALVDLLVAVNPRLAAGVIAITVVAGVLPAAFNVASGLVAGRVVEVTSMRALMGPLVTATAIYLAMHVLGPVREALGATLMRRLDAGVNLRVMHAMANPRGIAHLEDPDVLDRVSQAQGLVTGATPGAAAYYLVQVWAQRLQAVTSLAIVARFHVILAAALLGAHVVSYRWRRWHWREVTSIVMDRTEGMRRAHYMRRLAVEADAAKEARVFTLAAWLRDRYRAEFLSVMNDVWRTRRNGAGAALGVTVLLLAVEGGLLTLVARDAVEGRVSVAAAVVFAQSVIAASQLGVFGEGHLYLADGAAALHVLRGLEESVPTAGADLDGELPADGLPAQSIRFDNVAFRYAGRDVDVYRGLDLEIEAGTSLAIVGENGAGKTTLVKLLARLYDPTAGRILIDGIDLRDIDPASWQRRVAALFQDFVHYQLSAADNVGFGALHVPLDESRLDEAAELGGASAVIDALPAGWRTPMSRQFRGGVDLSGGEWQRLALARAVYAVKAGAGVLILDEPTAALDVRGEAEVYDRFLELTRGLTTIVISHRFSTVRRADRIVVVEHGRVVEDGTHEALVARGGRYATMYALQAARFRDEEPVAGA